MKVNFLLILFAIILLYCIMHGARRGMFRIIFGLLSWVLLICFVNYGTPFVGDIIKNNTGIHIKVEQIIDSNLHTRYESAEDQEKGSGEDAVMALVPKAIKDKIEDSVQTSIDNTIKLIAEELTDAAIHGIAVILVITLGLLVILIIDRLLKGLGFIPGIKDVNKLLGMLAGAFEGLLVIWLILFIADCFPASEYGSFVLDNTQKDQMLIFIYQNNLIEQIIGI